MVFDAAGIRFLTQEDLEALAAYVREVMDNSEPHTQHTDCCDKVSQLRSSEHGPICGIMLLEDKPCTCGYDAAVAVVEKLDG